MLKLTVSFEKKIRLCVQASCASCMQCNDVDLMTAIFNMQDTTAQDKNSKLLLIFKNIVEFAKNSIISFKISLDFRISSKLPHFFLISLKFPSKANIS